MQIYKDDKLSMGHSSFKQVYIDELQFMVYKFGDKKRLNEELNIYL